MAEDDKKGLLEGTQPPLYSPPQTPNNEYAEALFHEKGNSPQEVHINVVLLYLDVHLLVMLHLARSLLVNLSCG